MSDRTMAEASQRSRQVPPVILAGAIAGFLVLGVGGRLLMRAVAFTAAEAPRFSLGGTLEVVGLGMLWGAVTAPLLLLAGRAQRDRRLAGVIHGLLVLAAAVAVFFLLTGGGGRVVAPPLFIVSSAVLFPLLFVAHGCTVHVLVVRWLKA